MATDVLELTRHKPDVLFIPGTVNPSVPPDDGKYYFDNHRRLLRPTSARGALAESVLSIENGTLRFRNHHVAQRVDQVLGHVGSSPDKDAAVTLIFTQPRPFQIPIVLRLHAERAEGLGVIAALILVDLERRHHLPETLLRLTFGLTRAEATLASALAAGETLQDIAQRTSVRMPTLRTQLANVLAKTGTARQPQLICLLSKMAMLTGEQW